MPDLRWLFGKPLREQAQCGPAGSKQVVNPNTSRRWDLRVYGTLKETQLCPFAKLTPREGSWGSLLNQAVVGRSWRSWSPVPAILLFVSEASLQAVSVCWAPDFTLANSVPKILNVPSRLAWPCTVGQAPYQTKLSPDHQGSLEKRSELSGSLVSQSAEWRVTVPLPACHSCAGLHHGAGQTWHPTGARRIEAAVVAGLFPPGSVCSGETVSSVAPKLLAETPGIPSKGVLVSPLKRKLQAGAQVTLSETEKDQAQGLNGQNTCLGFSSP